ncbi:hypothetical protein NUU61_008860 [Penicillium alfredii]|uniref:Uncharacterized protein n=1 Tax=Penicillium alfredii TaxID=1506179 RepID=A0A9W9EMA1_9EURO|nr:uncharacterized protein NUU61_008860 [Penicillium alfredii]KAJ5084281.1 hypothetical protein NUU61_008860 [Penicillium alfredii]
MTGLFTYRNFDLRDTPALDGRVAVVTVCVFVVSCQITAQLLLHGIAKIFIVARSADKFQIAREEWRQREGISLGENDARVEFVKCDLGNISDVKAAAEKIKHKTDQVHILICNADAGLGVPKEYKRSPQNIEWVFATNCVGHQVLVTLLLPLLKKALLTSSNGDVRVVVTSSSLHLVCRRLDLDQLISPSRIKWPALYDGVWRYGRSKLGNILFVKELSRRLLQDRDPATKHIYVNAFFPGNVVTDQWLGWSAYVGRLVGSLVRLAGTYWGQSLEDGAATALFLATSDEVRDKNHRGQYFVPIATACEPSAMGQDLKLARDLWVNTHSNHARWLADLRLQDWIDAQATETLGVGWQ